MISAAPYLLSATAVNAGTTTQALRNIAAGPRYVWRARQIAMLVGRETLHMTDQDIGILLNREPSAIRWGIKQALECVRIDPVAAELARCITRDVNIEMQRLRQRDKDFGLGNAI